MRRPTKGEEYLLKQFARGKLTDEALREKLGRAWAADLAELPEHPFGVIVAKERRRLRAALGG